MGINRTGWELISENKEENVGQHTSVTSIAAILLAPELEQKQPLNWKKILIMAAIHDFHEGRTGELHKVSKKYVKRDQDLANQDIFSEFPELLKITKVVNNESG